MKKYIVGALIIFSSCRKEAVVDMTPINAKGEILFISRRIPNSSDWQMFLMNADGTNQRKVSNTIVQPWPPIVSNSGTKVIFINYDSNYNYNLYVVNVDGTNQKLLAQSKQSWGSPTWSPDDSRIAFVKSDNTSATTADIYSMKADGSNEIRLTTQNYNSSPQYVSDNKSMIFSSSNNNSWTGIYKMNIDGSNKQLLTPQNKSFSNPQISPDGNMIAITSNDGISQIFVMNSDGSNLKQITFTVSPQPIDVGFPLPGNINPVWSPNSDKIAYVSYENGSPDIFAINPNGTGNKRLTNTPLRDEYPAWTKDGDYILFSSNRNPNVGSQIYIMRTDGQLQTALTTYSGDSVYPTFIAK